MVCLLLTFWAASLAAQGPGKRPRGDTLYALKATSISGEEVPLARFQGKVILVVNTASKCGFTPQYHDLEELYKEYHDLGLEILAFPSDDFGHQEPGSNEEIQKFCVAKYGVTFPIFQKRTVRGPKKQPVYRFLTEQSGQAFAGEIDWNFEKFLVGPDGKVKARFGSYVNPQSIRIRERLDSMLRRTGG